MRTFTLLATMALLMISFTQCSKKRAGKDKDAPKDGSGQVAQAPAKLADAPDTKAVGLQVGDVAPDFSLMNVDDAEVSLTGMQDAEGYIVVFTCNHCPYSVAYEDRLIELHNTYAPQGFPVVAINPNDPEKVPEDSFEAMKERAAEKGFPFVYLMDEGQKVYPQYGATRTPHVFLLDKSLTVRYIGAIDDNHTDAEAVQKTYLKDAIEAVMSDQAPNPAFTKAVGCSIKTQS